MTIFLSEQLKKLRKEKGNTQEEACNASRNYDSSGFQMGTR